ncbi:DpnII family type II restriction endonuclease [Mesoplasma coleopterae]|uniref:DpnII family type II restriction endonuclease n=1 Tax=Mesoplasma coleopterae TaxID=324078 RepID=UPI0013DF016C|nr:DpnII family type II restriction endonuclease [Mesoplasma coleopterae]
MKNLSFDNFFSTLKKSTIDLNYFTDYSKMIKEINEYENEIEILNTVFNYSNITEGLNAVFEKYSFVKNIIFDLIAVGKDKKITVQDKVFYRNSLSNEEAIEILKETKLLDHLGIDITDLKHLLMGIKIGLDSNARKNRSGKIMVEKVKEEFDKQNIDYLEEVNKTKLLKNHPHLKEEMDQIFKNENQNKRFDIVFEKNGIIFLGEINAYNNSGSKLNSIAREYAELANRINATKHFRFFWITDGGGWKSAKKDLMDAYTTIINIFNLWCLENKNILEEMEA